MSTPYPPQDAPHQQPQAPTCYRHPDRPTYVQCTRCGRPICPDCMNSAAVGHQCPECVQAAAVTVRRAKTRWVYPPTVVTYTLIGINVLMFLLQKLTPAQSNGESVVTNALWLWPRAVAHGEWWRLISSAFLHSPGNLTHILFNMWALWVIGPPLEKWLGRSRFLALYLLSALGGSVLVYLLSPLDVPTLGASGAIFGLFGATLVIGKRVKMDVRGIVAVIAINLAFTFVYPLLSSQQISWQAHVGGLLTGMALSWFYAYTPRERKVALHTWGSLALLAVFIVAIWLRTSQLWSMYS